MKIDFQCSITIMSETKLDVIQHAINITILDNIQKRIAKMNQSVVGQYFMMNTIHTLHSGGMKNWIKAIITYNTNKHMSDVTTIMNGLSQTDIAEFVKNWIAVFSTDAVID